MAVAQYYIEKLNANNYTSWCSDMKYLLMEKGLWEIIRDSVSVCVEGDAISFKRRSDQLLSLLYLNIEPDFRKIIENCDNPVEAWQKLKDNYCPDSRAFHMKVFTELMESRIKNGESINLFAARIFRLYNKLRDIDKNFSETYVNFQLLRFLPARFDGVVQNILRWEELRFSFSNITTELVSEETRLEVRSHDRQTTVEAQFVGSKRQVTCYKCGIPGHTSYQCRKPDRQGLPHKQWSKSGGSADSSVKGFGSGGNPSSNRSAAFRGRKKDKNRGHFKNNSYASDSSL